MSFETMHMTSVSALCKLLEIPRSTYYFEASKKTVDEIPLITDVLDI